MHLVSFFQQQFRQIGPILTGDSGDEGASIGHEAIYEAASPESGVAEPLVPSSWCSTNSRYRPPCAMRVSWSPISTMRPLSITAMRSAERTVDRRWAMTSE